MEITHSYSWLKARGSKLIFLLYFLPFLSVNCDFPLLPCDCDCKLRFSFFLLCQLQLNTATFFFSSISHILPHTNAVFLTIAQLGAIGLLFVNHTAYAISLRPFRTFVCICNSNFWKLQFYLSSSSKWLLTNAQWLILHTATFFPLRLKTETATFLYSFFIWDWKLRLRLSYLSSALKSFNFTLTSILCSSPLLETIQYLLQKFIKVR